jgi:hypothetical protein
MGGKGKPSSQVYCWAHERAVRVGLRFTRKTAERWELLRGWVKSVMTWEEGSVCVCKWVIFGSEKTTLDTWVESRQLHGCYFTRSSYYELWIEMSKAMTRRSFRIVTFTPLLCQTLRPEFPRSSTTPIHSKPTQPPPRRLIMRTTLPSTSN